MNLKPEELIREAMRANPDVGDADDSKGGLTMERLTFEGNFKNKWEWKGADKE